MATRTRRLIALGHRIELTGEEEDTYLTGLGENVDDDVLHLLGRILPPDAVVADVGANLGLLTLAASRLAPEGNVHAFEPIPSTAAHLAANVRANSADNVTCHAVALGAEPGEVTLFENTEFTAGSTVLDHAAPIARKLMSGGDDRDQGPNRLVKVPTTTLDAVAAEQGIDRLDLLKSDTEGFDLDVLRGARKTMELCRPAVIVEFATFALTAHRQILPTEVMTELRDTFDRLFVVKRWGFLSEIASDRNAMDVLYANAMGHPVHDLVGVFHDSRLAGAVDSLAAESARQPEAGAPSGAGRSATELAAELEAMKRTLSWRITRPLRRIRRLMPRRP